MIGTFLAVRDGVSFNVPTFLLLTICVLCIDMGTTAFNTFFDYIRGTDSPETNRETGKILIHQEIPPAYALIIGLTLFVIAFFFGILLCMLTSWTLLGIGILSVTIAFLYSGGPKPISSLPFGELFAGFFLGTLLVLIAYWTQTYCLRGEIILNALPSYFMIAAILTTNNTCDIIGDKKSGRKTFSILFGKKIGSIYIYAQIISATLILIFTGIATPSKLPTTLAGIIIIAFSLKIMITMNSRNYSHDTKDANMLSILKIFSIYTFFYIIALLSEYLLGLF